MTYVPCQSESEAMVRPKAPMRNPADMWRRAARGRARAMRRAIALALVTGLAAGGIAREVRAAATTPTLVLTTAAPAVVGGARAVAVEATCGLPTALVAGYPLRA